MSYKAAPLLTNWLYAQHRDTICFFDKIYIK